MRTLRFLLVLVSLLWPATTFAAKTPAKTPAAKTARAPRAVPARALRAFADSLIGAEMAKARIPGAGFVFVQNGRIVAMRGYGIADVARRRPVVPESTIWRVGSISKVFTATAVMQLVDRGLVDLDSPIDRYVHRVTVPTNFDAPITVRQLLDHTGGLDEIRPGTQAATADEVLPLDRFLQTKLVRVRPPGRTIAYSTYGITLLGEMIEEIEKAPFEAVLKKSIWTPLKMSRSSINVPAELRGDLAMGYEIEGDSLKPQAWEWYHTTPASSVNATVADMARFLLAHLGGGRIPGDGRILSARTEKEMQRQQVTMDPKIPGYALGFYEDYVGDVRVLEHGGNVAGFSAAVVLIPEANAGYFIVNHFEGSRLENDFKWLLLERFFPRARVRKPVPPLPRAETVHAERYAGRYMPLTSCFSCQPMRAGSLTTVTANADGTLTSLGSRWIALDSLRFVNQGGTGIIVFRPDSTGTIRHLFAGSFWSWERVPEDDSPTGAATTAPTADRSADAAAITRLVEDWVARADRAWNERNARLMFAGTDSTTPGAIIKTPDGRTISREDNIADLQRRMNMTTRIDTMKTVVTGIQFPAPDSAVVTSYQRFVRWVSFPDQPERQRISSVIHRQRFHRETSGWKAEQPIEELQPQARWADGKP